MSAFQKLLFHKSKEFLNEMKSGNDDDDDAIQLTTSGIYILVLLSHQ